MPTPKFKANDFVRIVPAADLSFLSDDHAMIPDESLVGLVGIVRATFSYVNNKQVTDYDVAIIGRKYKSHHQHEAIDERFLELFKSAYEDAA